MEFAKHVLVVEGPAGSGKSTLIHRLHDDLRGSDIIPRFAPYRPRDFGETAPKFSLVKDTHTSVMMLTRGGAFPILLVDRWVVSQWVYGTLRRNTAPRPQAWMTPRDYHGIQVLLYRSLETLSALYQELLIREEVDEANAGASDPPTALLPFQLHFVMQLPAVTQLEIQRQHAGKVYPFSAEHELSLYRYLASFGTGWAENLKGINIHFYSISYTHEFGSWEHGYAHFMEELGRHLG